LDKGIGAEVANRLDVLGELNENNKTLVDYLYGVSQTEVVSPEVLRYAPETYRPDVVKSLQIKTVDEIIKENQVSNQAAKSFFTLDDTSYIEMVKQIKNVQDYLETFTYALQPQTYRPISIQTYFLIMTYLFGTKPFYYHLANVSFFIFNSVVLFLIIKTITKNENLAFLSTFIYLTRSAHTLAVFYVAAGEELIMAFFLLLSFYFYLKVKEAKNKITYTVSILLFVLSLLSKETAIFFPLALFAYEIIFISEQKNFLNKISSSFKKTNLYFLVMAIYIILKFFVIPYRFDSGEFVFSIGPNVITNFVNYVLYSFNIYLNINLLDSIKLLILTFLIIGMGLNYLYKNRKKIKIYYLRNPLEISSFSGPYAKKYPKNIYMCPTFFRIRNRVLKINQLEKELFKTLYVLYGDKLKLWNPNFNHLLK